MEKLQAAIAKARASRETGQTVVHGAVEAAPDPVVSENRTGHGASLWSALPEQVANRRQLWGEHIVALDGGGDAMPYDMMRTRVLQQMQINNWRRVAVTSPTQLCGKSTVSLNLAFSLARQSEQRVILGELDLRRPALATTLRLRLQNNFADVLGGAIPFGENAVRYGENLAIAANMGPVRNSSELLQGTYTATALTLIEESYDPTIMLFDMPPLMGSDDTMGFIRNVDAVLLIAGAGISTAKQIDDCERELAGQTNVMGVVLNNCRYLEDRQYQYYGH